MTIPTPSPQSCVYCGRLVVPVPGYHAFLNSYQVPSDGVRVLTPEAAGYARPLCIERVGAGPDWYATAVAWQTVHLARRILVETTDGAVLVSDRDRKVTVVWRDGRECSMSATVWKSVNSPTNAERIVTASTTSVLMLVNSDDAHKVGESIAEGSQLRCDELLSLLGALSSTPDRDLLPRCIATFEGSEPHTAELWRLYLAFRYEVRLPASFFAPACAGKP